MDSSTCFASCWLLLHTPHRIESVAQHRLLGPRTCINYQRHSAFERRGRAAESRRRRRRRSGVDEIETLVHRIRSKAAVSEYSQTHSTIEHNLETIKYNPHRPCSGYSYVPASAHRDQEQRRAFVRVLRPCGLLWGAAAASRLSMECEKQPRRRRRLLPLGL